MDRPIVAPSPVCMSEAEISAGAADVLGLSRRQDGLARGSAGAMLLWDRDKGLQHGSPCPDPNPQVGTNEAEIPTPLPWCRRGLLCWGGGFAQRLLQSSGGMEK